MPTARQRLFLVGAMQFDVVVLGSLHMDIMVATKDRPRKGETVVGSAWSLKCGGKGGNQAVEAARHGAVTTMIGMVGSDNFASRLVQNLANLGVDTESIGTVDGVGSGMSVAIVDEQGDYGAVIVSGANLLLDSGHVHRSTAVFDKASWLVIQNEVPDQTNVEAARIARRASARVLYNAAPVRTFAENLLGLVDILVVNALEAEGLCGIEVENLSDAAAAAQALLPYADTIVVTAGGAGVAFAQRDERGKTLQAHPLTVTSTHGAGDCFIGALAARLAAGESLEQALRYSNAAAALLVAGSPDAARGHEAVRRFLQEYPD
jgi:ribokinase